MFQPLIFRSVRSKASLRSRTWINLSLSLELIWNMAPFFRHLAWMWGASFGSKKYWLPCSTLSCLARGKTIKDPFYLLRYTVPGTKIDSSQQLSPSTTLFTTGPSKFFKWSLYWGGKHVVTRFLFKCHKSAPNFFLFILKLFQHSFQKKKNTNHNKEKKTCDLSMAVLVDPKESLKIMDLFV